MGSLQRYRDKRNFERTPEPRGIVTPSQGPLRFVIQKHAASALHFDLRLELDGVLKSWALPREPRLEPGEKRLAVHTEDHPTEYRRFEGTIPEGEYGAGVMKVWDEGTWVPDGSPTTSYRRGQLKFELKGRKMKGHWALVRMGNAQTPKRDLWLLVKRESPATKAAIPRASRRRPPAGPSHARS